MSAEEANVSQEDLAGSLQAELDKLVAAEVLFSHGRAPRMRYTFKHALIQDAAYNSLVTDVKVLLLEAGGPDDHPDVHDPVKWPTLFYGELDWGYKTAPLRHCNNRIDHLPRGKMLGGCHSHNANAWVRGHRNDFDSWAYQGCTGWGWDVALRLFKKIEDWHGPKSDLRGIGGPLYVAPPVDPNPLAPTAK